MKQDIIIALDYPSMKEALKLVDTIAEVGTWYKVGKELFTSQGPAIIHELKQRNKKVFLDLKFHDIPNTVCKAIQAAINLDVDMVNFHASGGKKMMQQIYKENQNNNCLLIAVTILTSFCELEFSRLNFKTSLEDTVLNLAQLAYDSGINGVVCSPQEISAIRNKITQDFTLVVPGIRPQNSQDDDQVRITTPKMAIEKGANYLVIGRPITKNANPKQAYLDILKTI